MAPTATNDNAQRRQTRALRRVRTEGAFVPSECWRCPPAGHTRSKL